MYAKQDWQQNARKTGVDHLIRFEAFDAENMVFDDALFDAIFFSGVLHHIDEKFRTQVMNESVRAAKSVGVICFFEPKQKGMKVIKDFYPSHPAPADPTMYMLGCNVTNETITGEFLDAFIFRKEGIS